MSDRIGFIADVHIHNHKQYASKADTLFPGVNGRCQEILDGLFSACGNPNVDAVVILGDLFDTPRPTPQILHATMQAFLGSGNPVYVLVGNHDQVSTEPLDNALAPFNLIPAVNVIEEPAVIEIGSKTLALVPYQPGNASKWLPEVLAELDPPEASILCIHLGIMDGDTPHYLKECHDAVHVDLLRQLIAEHRLGGVFAGNWHHQEKWLSAGVPIIQVGALVPTGFDNPGLTGYGGLCVLEDSEVKFYQVPGPRYVKVTCADDLDAYLDLIKEMEVPNFLRVRWEAPMKSIPEVRRSAEKYSSIPEVDVLEIMPSKEETLLATRSAAIAARSASTLEDALCVFVDRMPTGEGVNKGEVLESCKSYLGIGKCT